MLSQSEARNKRMAPPLFVTFVYFAVDPPRRIALVLELRTMRKKYVKYLTGLIVGVTNWSSQR